MRSSGPVFEQTDRQTDRQRDRHTVYIDDNQRSECDARSSFQLSSHELHRLIDLTTAFLQVLLHNAANTYK